MDVKVRLTAPDEAYKIKNMYPLYLHDLSEHLQNLPNEHGIYEESDDYRTLTDQYEVQQIWWDKPNILFPFMFTVDERPAGFGLVATPPHCTPGIQYFVNEFFVLRPYRGKGVAQQAAVQLFNQFKGKWELYTSPAEANGRAQQFWRRTLAEYGAGKVEETRGNTFAGDKIIFRFHNTDDT
ncbi:GNAT family N-acetyltransferase [Paenibacillus sp. 481]|uniref:GNAT family N-acetyltransferase n=1 Tax=Paenibacillus sp. 481 TaxID=2835869 RepID=UPI001E3C0E2B|nr:GNAT family N-acetyltransferase [Paenibacillus sp. 481]UHA73716.1 GNAT family N-acetyltransferase [Paenibacillus sp. 481]